MNGREEARVPSNQHISLLLAPRRPNQTPPGKRMESPGFGVVFLPTVAAF
jgi:hypothetical protein